MTTRGVLYGLARLLGDVRVVREDLLDPRGPIGP